MIDVFFPFFLNSVVLKVIEVCQVKMASADKAHTRISRHMLSFTRFTGLV